MQLRNHSKMTYQGQRSWPPSWSGSYGPNTKFPMGEQGVLREIRKCEPFGSLPNHLLLVIEYEGHTHSGPLLLEDADFSERVYKKLSECVDMPMQRVGDLELDAPA